MNGNNRDAITTLFTVYNTADGNSTDRQLARELIVNMNKIATASISEASELCHFSPATISRFCKSMGFDCYSAFRKSMREASAGIDMVDYVFANNQRGNESVTTSYLRQISEMYRDFSRVVDENAIREMAQAIHKSKNISLYSPTANSVYHYLQIDFALDGLIVTSCRDEEELSSSVCKFDSSSYLLVFKHQLKWGKFVDTSVLTAKQNGGQVGMISNSARTPVKKSVDHFLCFDGMLHYVDNLFMDTYCMLLSAIYREMFLGDKS